MVGRRCQVSRHPGAEGDHDTLGIQRGCLGGGLGQRKPTDRILNPTGLNGRHADARGGNGQFDSVEGDFSESEHHPPSGQVAHDGGSGERFAALGEVAESSRDVHTVPDVVVTFHQDHLTRRDSRSDRHRLDRARDRARDVVELENGGEQWRGIDAHQHDAIPQPFGDPHSPS